MPKNNFERGFKKHSEEKAIEIRKTFKINYYDRLPARDLAQSYNLKIISPRNIHGLDRSFLNTILKTGKSNWSAITLKLQNSGIIILNDTHSLQRQESDIFHEIAHGICKHEMKGFINIGNSLLRDYNDKQENEANWLGGCLHIPRSALLWAFRNKKSKDQIAKHFCASIDLVNYRINVTGIKRQFNYID